MVWNEGGNAPVKKHMDAQSAKDEADRLAAKHPEQRFAVLQAMDVRVCHITPPEVLRCVKETTTF